MEALRKMLLDAMPPASAREHHLRDPPATGGGSGADTGAGELQAVPDCHHRQPAHALPQRTGAATFTCEACFKSMLLSKQTRPCLPRVSAAGRDVWRRQQFTGQSCSAHAQCVQKVLYTKDRAIQIAIGKKSCSLSPRAGAPTLDHGWRRHAGEDAAAAGKHREEGVGGPGRKLRPRRRPDGQSGGHAGGTHWRT